jgi:hypothetical protein
LIPAVEVAAHMSIHGIQRVPREGDRMDRVTSRALYGKYAWAYDLLIGCLVSRQWAFVAERSAACGRTFQCLVSRSCSCTPQRGGGDSPHPSMAL